MDTITVAKIIAVPLLLWLVSLMGRRWGTFAASVFAGLPIVSGPVSLFITLEQGPAFAEVMAYNILPGISACVFENIAYAWLARRFSWIPTVILTLILYFGFAAVLCLIPYSLVFWTAAAFLAPFIGLFLLPRPLGEWHVPPAHHNAPWLQMAVGMGAMIAETEGAAWLGPQWSGMLVFFPVLSGVIGMFAHIEAGPDAALRVFRGTLTGLSGATVFAIVVAWAVASLPVAATYSLATLSAVAASVLLAAVLKKDGIHAFLHKRTAKP